MKKASVDQIWKKSAVPSKMMSVVQAIARKRDGNRGSPGKWQNYAFCEAEIPEIRTAKIQLNK